MELQVLHAGASLIEQSSSRIDFRWRGWGKPIAFLGAAVVILLLSIRYHQYLTPAALAGDVERLHGWQEAHPIALPLLLAATFIVSTGLSIPAVITLSVLSGWLLGTWEGLLITSFASTAGATVAFLISRYLLRDAIARQWPEIVARADEMVERDGAFYLLSLRLVHVIPSWLINLVVGCTRVRAAIFWWTTQLGMLPSTAFYVYAGAHLKSLAQIKEQGVCSIATPQVIGAFVVLAILPLAARKAIQRFSRPQ
ncbi:MAG TPA: TVP38/TMEM64 family protein [Pirellulales bacterium]|nr:TVP38/TMEM64 family protein [Pirellulales bacterium]